MALLLEDSNCTAVICAASAELQTPSGSLFIDDRNPCFGIERSDECFTYSASEGLAKEEKKNLVRKIAQYHVAVFENIRLLPCLDILLRTAVHIFFDSETF
ncbi:hypothetical protein GJ744_007732 [Endocarpon pusillum]|uniref:Uncharacterized protein n=1 Tax=Endocarpon pusillum TaxID=364733 RepID=A0A8H7AVC2_9EURO|nr:hypothetical protein GJ744_007732 [Endocarpon pusillum]